MLYVILNSLQRNFTYTRVSRMRKYILRVSCTIYSWQLVEPELALIMHEYTSLLYRNKDHIKIDKFFANLLIVKRGSKTKSIAEIFQGNLAFKE